MATLELVDENTAETKEAPRVSRASVLAEDRSAEYVVSGVNEEGKRVWFYRIHVGGLYPRLFGPFTRKSDAIEGFDAFLQKTLEVLSDCYNETQSIDRRAMEFIQAPAYLDQKGR